MRNTMKPEYKHAHLFTLHSLKLLLKEVIKISSQIHIEKLVLKIYTA